jgi:hypothetical protein
MGLAAQGSFSVCWVCIIPLDTGHPKFDFLCSTYVLRCCKFLGETVLILMLSQQWLITLLSLNTFICSSYEPLMIRNTKLASRAIADFCSGLAIKNDFLFFGAVLMQ